jgi:ABC-type Mn2+/Zn2+ transport system permease subunit
MSWLMEPFELAFLQRSLLAAVVIGVLCAVLGCYVVLRRMAFLGDALAHTALPGVVVAYLNGWSLLGGALVAGLATAFGVGWLSRRQEVREDTAIGVLFTAMFALGILLGSRTGSYRDLGHILFGNLLGVGEQELRGIVGVAVLVLTLLWTFHKELELASFDPTHAEVIGLSTGRLRYLLLVLLALAVVTGIQAVGVVLTSALLVTPAAAASLLTERLSRMMLLAAIFAVISATVGLVLSFHLEVPSGAAIVLACTACFAVAWALAAVRRTLAAKEVPC